MHHLNMTTGTGNMKRSSVRVKVICYNVCMHLPHFLSFNSHYLWLFIDYGECWKIPLTNIRNWLLSHTSCLRFCSLLTCFLCQVDWCHVFRQVPLTFLHHPPQQLCEPFQDPCLLAHILQKGHSRCQGLQTSASFSSWGWKTSSSWTMLQFCAIFALYCDYVPIIVSELLQTIVPSLQNKWCEADYKTRTTVMWCYQVQ